MLMIAVLASAVRVPLSIQEDAKQDQSSSSPYRGKQFTVYSHPVTMEYGQVHNTFQKAVPLPEEVVKDFAGGNMVITGYQNDVVEFDSEGNPIGSIPLYDCYLHHYGAILGSSEHFAEFYDEMTSNSVPVSEGGPGDDFGLHSSYRGSSAGHMNMKHIQALYKGFLRRKGKGGAGAGGGGSGAEERHTLHSYPAPYALEAGEINSLMPFMHLINTRGSVTPGEGYSKMAECICSSDRVFDIKNGTIDGKRPNIAFSCNLELLAQKNPSCSLETYEHGFRCCEDKWYVSEPAERAQHKDSTANFGMKFTFYYEPATPETVTLRAPGCCDVTGNISHTGQIEYDIPQCKEGEECIHKAVTYQYIDLPHKGGGSGPFGPGREFHDGEEIDIVYAAGHLHLGAEGALGISLYKDATDELLCKSTPVFGEGTEPGNEKGYVVGMTPCIFGGKGMLAPPRLRRNDVVRIEAFYDSTQPHYGVMALWLMQVADVPKDLKQSVALQE